jgi:hypothetical protein
LTTCRVKAVAAYPLRNSNSTAMLSSVHNARTGLLKIIIV